MKYENITRKRSWLKTGDPPQTISRPGLSKNKVIPSVWWGIVHYELLQPGETIDSVINCAQLERLNEGF